MKIEMCCLKQPGNLLEKEIHKERVDGKLKELKK